MTGRVDRDADSASRFREADCEWVRIPGQQFDSKVVLTRVVASLAEIKPNERAHVALASLWFR